MCIHRYLCIYITKVLKHVYLMVIQLDFDFRFATPDLSSTGVVCIQFAYTAHGTQVGKLIVYAQKGSQTATRKEIWQSPEVNVKNWILERLPYSVESGERVSRFLLSCINMLFHKSRSPTTPFSMMMMMISLLYATRG